MLGRRPVDKSTVVHVLLIDTLTHSGIYPAVFNRKNFTAVSVVYWNCGVTVEKKGDFELDIDLLLSLVEAMPVLWDKTDDIYRERNERNEKVMEWSLYLTSRRFWSFRKCFKNAFVE